MIDSDQYEILKTSHGDVVPPREVIGIRRGLLSTVVTLLAHLRQLDPTGDGLRVRRVWSVNAGFLKVVVDGDMPGLNDVISKAEESARLTCEHCGLRKPDLIVLKQNQDRDLLLCRECVAVETAKGN